MLDIEPYNSHMRNHKLNMSFLLSTQDIGARQASLLYKQTNEAFSDKSNTLKPSFSASWHAVSEIFFSSMAFGPRRPPEAVMTTLDLR